MATPTLAEVLDAIRRAQATQDAETFWEIMRRYKAARPWLSTFDPPDWTLPPGVRRGVSLRGATFEPAPAPVPPPVAGAAAATESAPAPGPVSAAVSLEGGLASGPIAGVLAGLELLGRPGAALRSGFASMARGMTERGEDIGPGDLAALLNPQAWRDFARGAAAGWRGETRGNLISEADPRWAAENPRAAAVADAVTGFVVDPLLIAGGLAARALGPAVRAGAAYATGAPELLRAAEAAGPAVQAVRATAGQVLRRAAERPGAVGAAARLVTGAPAEYQALKRQFQAARQEAVEQAAREGLEAGAGLTPEQEEAARRLMERPAPGEAALVDQALQAARQPARKFRPVSTAERDLKAVIDRAEEIIRRAQEERVPQTMTRSRLEQWLAKATGFSRAELSRLSHQDLLELQAEVSRTVPVPTAEQAARQAAAELGLDLDEVIERINSDPSIRPVLERARLRAVAGAAPPPPRVRLRRPGEPDVAAAEEYLVQQGVERPVAQAAIRGRQLTESIVETARREGLPLNPRENYFPRVPEQGGGPVELVRTVTRRLLRGLRDPFAQGRVIDPEASIDELIRRREAGEPIPAFRRDFKIPLAVRNAAAAQRLATHQFVREALRRFGEDATGRDVAELADSGLVAVVYKPESGLQVIRSGAAPEGAVALPRTIAQDLSSVYTLFGTDDGLAELARLWRAFDRFWKQTVTIARTPAYTATNLYGGFINNLLSGVTTVEPYRVAAKIARAVARGETPRGAIPTPAGSMELADVWSLANSTGAIQGGLTRSVLGPQGLVTEVERLAGRPARGLIARLRRINETAENFNRLAIFVDRLMKTGRAADAVEATLAAHFDYSNEALMPIERVLRDYFSPFYTWTRNNLIFHLRNFVEKPALYQAYLRAAERATEHGRGNRPPYQQYALETGLEVGGRRVVLNLGGVDPVLSVVEALRRPGDALQALPGPLWRLTYGLLSGEDPFTGAPIPEHQFIGPIDVPGKAAFAVRTLGGRPAEVLQAFAQTLSNDPEERLLGALALARQAIPGASSYSQGVEWRRKFYEKLRAAEALYEDLPRRAGVRRRIGTFEAWPEEDKEKVRAVVAGLPRGERLLLEALPLLRRHESRIIVPAARTREAIIADRRITADQRQAALRNLNALLATTTQDLLTALEAKAEPKPNDTTGG